MRRITSLELVIAVIFVVASFIGCPKKEETPPPEPTPIVEPTVPPTQESICLRFAGSPGNPPVCEDGANNQVTCPTNTDMLPLCN